MSFVGLEFFNPREVTPTLSAHDYTGTLIDRLVIGGNLLESTLAVKRYSGGVWGQGQLEMTLAPRATAATISATRIAARRASKRLRLTRWRRSRHGRAQSEIRLDVCAHHEPRRLSGTAREYR
jgi:hypothetical protein